MSKTTHAGYCRPSSQLRQASRLVLGGSTALGLIGATLLAPSAPAAAASSTSASSSASPSTSLSRSTAHSTARAGSPGAQSVHDSLFPSIGNGGYDALHYDIALRYAATSKSITARSTMTARATKKLSRFSLDLEKLTVSSVRVNHTAAKFSRHDAKLVITPRRAVSGRFTVSVSYHGKPVTHIDPDKALDGWIPTKDGATVLSEPLGAQTWFPNNNTPRDKATFRVAVSAPSSLAVAGNGDLAGKRRHGSATTWTWRQSKPMASYLAMISIGKYDVYHSTMRTSTGRKLPIWSFVDPALGSGKKQRDLIPQIIRYHEKNFGPYPFTSVGIVVKETGAGYALETQNRPTFDGLPDTLTEVHELAHQWYGDSVTAKRWEDIWLHEGFADYSERLWTAAHGGPSTKAQFLQTYRANDADAKLWTPAPARFSDPADLFGDPVYTRGGMTLEALRLKVGDRAFFTILKRWAAQKRYGTVTTGQFIALSEKVSGKNLDGLFAAWLYVAKKPAGY